MAPVTSTLMSGWTRRKDGEVVGTSGTVSVVEVTPFGPTVSEAGGRTQSSLVEGEGDIVACLDDVDEQAVEW